jgi:hypothetical protein
MRIETYSLAIACCRYPLESKTKNSDGAQQFTEALMLMTGSLFATAV